MATVCTAARVRVDPHALRSGSDRQTKNWRTAAVALGVVASVLAAPSNGLSQTTYQLPKEVSPSAELNQLRTTGPDVVAVALQTADLNSTSTGEKLVEAFDTQACQASLARFPQAPH